jgi:hypothetical protein
MTEPFSIALHFTTDSKIKIFHLVIPYNYFRIRWRKTHYRISFYLSTPPLAAFRTELEPGSGTENGSEPDLD